MVFPTAAILALASQCAPNVAPRTVAAIVQTESRSNPLALNVNRARQPHAQSTTAGAVATAQRYVAAGYSVDLGLSQINSRNMRMLGLTWETVFDPCTNIAALGRILTRNYESVVGMRDPQSALRLALSIYNTGSMSRGFRNGYVAKVVGNAGVAAATIDTDDASPAAPIDTRAEIAAENAVPIRAAASRRSPPPIWDVFETVSYIRAAATIATPPRGPSIWAD